MDGREAAAELAALGLRLTTTWARKLRSPNTSSISSRRWATSLSSMLTKIAPVSASTLARRLEPGPHHRRPTPGAGRCRVPRMSSR